MLDKKGEQEVLSEDELVELRDKTFELHYMAMINTSICWQQSWLLWLQEGDTNSKYFHSVMAGRRQGNTISSLTVDGGLVEDVNPVHEAVYNYFLTHFMAPEVVRPSVEGMEFCNIDQSDCVNLVRPFTIDEVKTAVWDSDRYKSPRPDGVNFGFIKDFWLEICGDVMRFIGDFHRNGRLTKGESAETE